MNWLVLSIVQLIAGVAERLTQKSPAQVAREEFRAGAVEPIKREIDEAARKRLRELH